MRSLEAEMETQVWARRGGTPVGLRSPDTHPSLPSPCLMLTLRSSPTTTCSLSRLRPAGTR